MLSKKTYTKIVGEYGDRIHNFIYKQLKNKQVAEDLTQECFLKLWKNRLFIKEQSCKSWLFTSAYHLVLNHVRDNKRLDFKDDLSDFGLVTKESTELKELLDLTFDQLSADEKTIILLKDSEGYNYKEIGEILSLSEQNVKSRLYRARQHFQEVYLNIQKQAKKSYESTK
jgi:RNA polymerase sigma factor (sigma-70 family)